jgi:hypothetical protein
MSQLVKPNCRMYDFVGAQPPSATSVRSHDHIGALASTDLIAPELSAALAKAGW